MTLKELRQSRGTKAARGKAATTEYNALLAKTDRTAEDDAKMQALDTELTALEADIGELDAKIAKEEATARRGALFNTAPAASIAAGLGARTTEPNPEATAGFNSIAEFGMAVFRASAAGGNAMDPRLSAGGASTLNQNGGSGGEGFLVPPDFLTEIYTIAFQQDDLLAMASPRPTSRNAVGRPKDESTPWGASGVQAYWRNEAAQMTSTKYSGTGELITLHELYAFTAATNEVLDDAPMLENLLTVQAGRAIKWKASDSIMWGDGVGKPLGFMKGNALITVNKDSGQAAATITLANLGNMLARVLRTGGRPFWMANPDIIPQLITMTIGNVPVWLPNNQPGQANPWDGTLLGYPVMFSEHSETLGTTGDITCNNLDGYFAATKANKGIDFASSMHLFFDTNETAFRWTFRLAGMPSLSKPVDPARGSTTKSHFVALQTRG